MPADEIIIREAQKGDELAVRTLWRSLMDEHAAMDRRFVVSDDAQDRWANDFPVWIEDGGHYLAVVALKNEVVGFVHARQWMDMPIFVQNPEIYLDEIYIIPAHRGKGMGKKLYRSVEAWSQEKGASFIRLTTLATNPESNAFWNALGARPLHTTYTVELYQAASTEKKTRGKLGFV